ncbi:hypothetical protein IYR97_23805 (plasmid) [Pseudomonas fulva]|uniref:Uncharacterized protein n=2 Tax=Pseudomonas putida group TaxID=136845 RepID=A0ABD7BPB9_PSEPU|nr:MULTISPECIES: hypothetical protein [Pseudomonas putida group]QOD01547.1 hypothetical protein ID616_30460 [Pseudomonas putida]QPH46822.1 hypothetical protein IYR97_23805 [Pseudomonas fulva]QPH51995.1 hypothetical protein IZU98_24255 [Pseudomonas fulva]
MAALCALAIDAPGCLRVDASDSINQNTIAKLVHIADYEKLAQVDIKPTARWAPAENRSSFIHDQPYPSFNFGALD